MNVNDFVLNIATVNGSGSQTANTVLLKTIFRMGIPVGGKNIFPSNIQGLPTWFWIRANPKGYIGRKAISDLVVSLNVKTQKQDLSTLKIGGFFLSEEAVDETLRSSRPDVVFVEIPFRTLIDGTGVAAKIKKLVVNMVYVGVLVRILGLDEQVALEVLRLNFGEKRAAFEANKEAFEAGFSFSGEILRDLKLDFCARRVNRSEQKIIVDGNSASALGLLAGGCSFISWYPITPSTSVVETFERFASQFRRDQQGRKTFAVLQAEDEIAAITMVLGAGWAGARAMTATSGPGMSLMSEAAGYAYYAEIPAVIWNVQRLGPSTGLPTRTAQGDLLFAAYLSHGDTRHILLIPGTPEECFEDGRTCFDLAEKFQQLVIVLVDLDLGMNLWMSNEFSDEKKPLERGLILKSKDPEDYARFSRYGSPDSLGLCARTLVGDTMPGAAYFTRGSGHNSKAQYTEDPLEYQELVQRLERKYRSARDFVPRPKVQIQDEDGVIGLICYGSSVAILGEMSDELQKKGYRFNILRIRAVPFSDDVERFLHRHTRILVIDQNRDGQMRALLGQEFPEFAAKMRSILHYDGTPITAEIAVAEFLCGVQDFEKEKTHVTV